ncbi:MAG: TetR/AcrR family transcriptional regulator [Sphingobacteriales bacterium]|nr:TetR/AcrR family transcriptional regulator [Sphingobacteriales bacterium]
MQEILSNLTIKVSEGLYQINPQTSKLGKNIVINSVTMIDEIGFEKFNFKKLGEEIGSPEASIYRYFKSKNQLLTYLISWYWGWMEYRLVLEITNIESADIRLTKSIALIASNTNEQILIEGIDIKKLHQIIISESIKSYLTKDVDKANKEGAFHNYKQFVERISKIIQEINPEYTYPQMLITTIVEGVHLQVFFADHLPRLTNKLETPNYISDFYINLAINTIKGNK